MKKLTTKIIIIVSIELIVLFTLFVCLLIFNGKSNITPIVSLILMIFLLYKSTIRKLINSKTVTMFNNSVYYVYQNVNKFELCVLIPFYKKVIYTNTLPIISESQINNIVMSVKDIIEISFFINAPTVSDFDFDFVNKYNIKDFKIFNNYGVVAYVNTSDLISEFITLNNVINEKYRNNIIRINVNLNPITESNIFSELKSINDKVNYK